MARARVRMGLGRLEEAAEDATAAIALGGGTRALEVAGWVAYYRRGYEEARAYADEALERLAPVAEWSGTMAWHQRHRWALARARLALATGDSAGAAELAAGVEADAGARGARRYALLAAAVGALAKGPGADIAAVDKMVCGLGECAALDGWPTVAALAGVFGVDEWRTEARRQAAAVLGAAPDRDAATALVQRIIG